MAIKPTKQQIIDRARRADAFSRRGDLNAAAATLHPVIEHARDLHDVVVFWAGLRARQGHYDEASDWYRHILKTHHDHIPTRQSLALCLRRSGRYDEAIHQIERIRESDPWNVMAVLTLVDTHATLNEHDKALALLDELEANIAPDSTDDESLARIAIIRQRLAPNAETAGEAVAAAANTQLHTETRASLAQHAGLAFQKAGRHDEAWDAFSASKQSRGMRFDADEHTKRTTASIDFWTSDEAKDLPVSDADGSKLVFIVGMPRSGTSLLEQMLGRLPGVAPMGERSEVLRLAGALSPAARPDLEAMITSGERLTEENLGKVVPMMTESFRSVASGMVEGEPTLMIDKQVFNFMHLPLIARAFPGARVLHIRRHPCDTALSCYSQWFNRIHHFTKDAASLGAYYREYLRMMEAWAGLPAPSQRPEILEVRYESLASDPESAIRPVLGFLGLGWNDDVLSPEQSERIVRTASRDQVRQSINTGAVGRWKPYAKHLAPFIEALGQGVIDEYESSL